MPDAQADLFDFRYSLPNLTESLKKQRKIKIVAIGSSSTAGEIHVEPYPSRLEILLRDRFHHRLIDVLNRGIGGQEAPSELSRFEPDVLAESPALVIWQVGTNAVFRKEEFDFGDVMVAIAAGLRWLKDLPIDVVLRQLPRHRHIRQLRVPRERILHQCPDLFLRQPLGMHRREHRTERTGVGEADRGQCGPDSGRAQCLTGGVPERPDLGR